MNTQPFSRTGQLIELCCACFKQGVMLYLLLAPASSKGFLDIQAPIECRFTLKRVREMIRTYSQMHRTDKYSQYSSMIWQAWLNGWVFVYELSGCGLESLIRWRFLFGNVKRCYTLRLCVGFFICFKLTPMFY